MSRLSCVSRSWYGAGACARQMLANTAAIRTARVVRMSKFYAWRRSLILALARIHPGTDAALRRRVPALTGVLARKDFLLLVECNHDVRETRAGSAASAPILRKTAAEETFEIVLAIDDAKPPLAQAGVQNCGIRGAGNIHIARSFGCATGERVRATGREAVATRGPAVHRSVRE